MALSGKITDFGVPESRVLEVPKLDSPSEKLRVWVQTVSVIHMQTKTVRRSMNLCQHDCTVHHRCYSPSTMGSLITRGLSLSSNAVNRVKVLPAWFSGNFCRKPAGFSAGKITPPGTGKSRTPIASWAQNWVWMDPKLAKHWWKCATSCYIIASKMI